MHVSEAHQPEGPEPDADASDRQSEPSLRAHIAAEVRRVRGEAGMSQAAVARVMGTKPSVVSRLEDPEASGLPSTISLRRLAGAVRSKGIDIVFRPISGTWKGEGEDLRQEVRLRMPAIPPKND